MFSCYDSLKFNLSKVTKKCNKCEIVMGSCVDCCCGSCCELFGDCLEGAGNCIGDCFPRPYAFCFCLSFSIFVAPFVYGLIGFFSSGNAICQTSLREHLLIMLLSFLVNLAFLSFLIAKFSKVGVRQHIYRVNETHPEIEQSVMQKTIGLLNYNAFICLYVMFMLFSFAWLIIGLIWNFNSDPCTPKTEANLLTAAHWFCLISLWIYNIGSLFILFTCVFIRSYEEGSCMSYDTLRFLVQCFTLGIVDLEKCHSGKEERKKARILKYRENKETYTVERKKWISKSVHIINLLGLGGQPKFRETEQTRQKRAIIKAGPNFGVIDIKNFEKVNRELSVNAVAFSTLGGNTIPVHDPNKSQYRDVTYMNETASPIYPTYNTRNNLTQENFPEDVPEDFNKTIEIKRLPILTDPNKEPKGDVRLDAPVVRDFYAVN